MLKSFQDHNQLQMVSLESTVDKNSIVRIIDVLVDLLDLKPIGYGGLIKKMLLQG